MFRGTPFGVESNWPPVDWWVFVFSACVGKHLPVNWPPVDSLVFVTVLVVHSTCHQNGYQLTFSFCFLRLFSKALARKLATSWLTGFGYRDWFPEHLPSNWPPVDLLVFVFSACFRKHLLVNWPPVDLLVFVFSACFPKHLPSNWPRVDLLVLVSLLVFQSTCPQTGHQLTDEFLFSPLDFESTCS